MTQAPSGLDDAEDIALSPDEEIAAYRRMLLIRRFEEKAGQLYAMQVIQGPCPLAIGQEAAIVGLTMAARETDPMIAGYRTHGHLLARGVEPRRIMAELMGRASGVSGGRGGTVRMFAPERGFYGGHAIPGLTATLATGLAFAARYRDEDRVVLAFYGDGAAARGRVLEAYRIAAEWKLPIVFAIDNNTAAPGAGIVLGRLPSAIAESGRPFALPGIQVDAIDVRSAHAAGRRAIERARAGEGPMLLELLTFRYRGHGGMPARPGLKRYEEADPVILARERLLRERILGERALKALEREVRDEVATAAQAARAEPPQEPGEHLGSVEA